MKPLRRALSRVERFFRGTRPRITLTSTAAMAAAIAVAVVGARLAIFSNLNGQVDSQLLSQAALIGAGLNVQGPDISFLGGPLPVENRDGIAVSSALLNTDGTMIATSQNQRLPVDQLESIARQVGADGHPRWYQLPDSNQVLNRIYVARVEVRPGRQVVLITEESLAEVTVTKGWLNVLLIAIALLAVTVWGALSYWVVGRALRPVHEIASLAATLGEQDLGRRVRVAAPDDELGELVRTFNQMLDRLQRSFDILSRFTADASHELRAPLTLIRTEIELALAGEAEARTPETFRVLLDEVDRMSRITDQLLTLARADAGELLVVPRPLDLVDLVQEVTARWRPVARKHDVRILARCPDSSRASADPDLTRRILDNLIDNAIRHAPPGSAITVSTRVDGAMCTFTVADEGPGIPPQMQDRLFVRFARLDLARTRGDGSGAGLGLAICSTLASVQGGSISLADGRRRGAAFEVVLPAAA